MTPAAPAKPAGAKPAAARQTDISAAPDLPGHVDLEAGARADDAIAGDTAAEPRTPDAEQSPKSPLAEREPPAGAAVAPHHVDRSQVAPVPTAAAARADALPSTHIDLDARSALGSLRATAAGAALAAGDAVERAPKPELDARDLAPTSDATIGIGAEASPGTPAPIARGVGAESLSSPPASATPAGPAAAADATLATTALASSDAASAGTGAPPAEARLPHPPQSPAFAAALGQQVSLWIRRGVQQAVLQLNPAELGPVAIHIALDGARAHVDFTAPHAATRAALEGSLPVLASALRDSGLTLAGGGVFDRPREQADGNGQGQAPSWTTPARGEDAARRDALPPPVVLQRRGVVDLVA